MKHRVWIARERKPGRRHMERVLMFVRGKPKPIRMEDRAVRSDGPVRIDIDWHGDYPYGPAELPSGVRMRLESGECKPALLVVEDS